MTIRKWTIAIALTAAASLRVSAQAPPPPTQPNLIGTMTLDQLQKILQGMGFDCAWDKDAKGNPEKFLVFQAEGYKVVARVPSPDAIWLYNIFTNDVSLEVVNEWNQDNNFDHAYIAKDKKLFFDTDIVLRGGVTRENIEAQIKEFRTALGKWARFVIDHEKGKGKGSGEK